VCSEATSVGPTRKGRSLKDKAKPFSISRWEVWEAYLKVKSNEGAAGLDGQSIADFERGLKKNLYRIWNRMSSGSYFPPPVRTVKIPKANGGERTLGIPTVSDRIAQMVVKNRLEAVVDPLFLPASYGYRPGKSALDAVGQARQMCWAYDWVCDLDIKGFFDNLDHGLMMKAVRKHAQERWMVLNIERWLKAPAQEEEGNLLQREKGTPQGGVISPLLANLFLHYAFDLWMGRNWHHLPFERYADDIIVHCRTEREANLVRVKIAARLKQCGLERIRRRRRWSIARMPTGGRLTCTRSLIFWGSRFDPGRQTDGKGSSVVSFQPSRRRRSRKYGMRFEDGNCIAVRGSPSEILRERSIRNFGGGSTTMGVSRLRRSGPSSGMSANRWFAGLVGNTRSYAITEVGHGLG
jgi:RNA-directed DNA polymerase